MHMFNLEFLVVEARDANGYLDSVLGRGGVLDTMLFKLGVGDLAC